MIRWLQVFLTLCILLVLYPRLLGGYQDVVLGASNTLLRGLPGAVKVGSDNDLQWTVTVQGTTARPGFGFKLGTGRLTWLVFLNLVTLPVLLVATPASPSVRLRLLVIGFAMLFIVHVVMVSACVLSMSWLCLGAPGELCRKMPGVLSPGGQGAAAALWALLAWRHWFPSGLGTSHRVAVALRGSASPRSGRWHTFTPRSSK